MMKSLKYFALTLFFLLCFSIVSVYSQTTLVAGDIAFSGYIGGNDPAVIPDEFSFVLLRNITAGTVINFTDNGWLSSNVFRSGETTVTWTATSALSAGQEIRIAGLTATLASGAGTPGTVTGTQLSLATSGDQILAYQGTVAAPTFISAIHMNVYAVSIGSCGNTTAASWDPNCVDGTNGTTGNANFSKLPTGLTTGVNAIWVGEENISTSESDNARFDCGTGNISTAAQARTSLNNQVNWLKTNGAPNFTLPTNCSYLVAPTAANVSLGGRVVQTNGGGIRNVIVTLTGGNLTTPRTTVTGSFGYFMFEDVEVGQTYIVSVRDERFRFLQSSKVFSVIDSIADIEFRGY